MANKSLEHRRYEVITQEDKDSGDMILPIPLPLLQQLGWNENDNIEIGVDEKGRLILKKANT